jgi:hypothetical protein
MTPQLPETGHLKAGQYPSHGISEWGPWPVLDIVSENSLKPPRVNPWTMLLHWH